MHVNLALLLKNYFPEAIKYFFFCDFRNIFYCFFILVNNGHTERAECRISSHASLTELPSDFQSMAALQIISVKNGEKRCFNGCHNYTGKHVYRALKVQIILKKLFITIKGRALLYPQRLDWGDTRGQLKIRLYLKTKQD